MINFDHFIDQAKHLAATLPLPSQVNTVEREGLRYRLYRTEQTPNDLIIVYHGGGVHLDANPFSTYRDAFARALQRRDAD